MIERGGGASTESQRHANYALKRLRKLKLTKYLPLQTKKEILLVSNPDKPVSLYVLLICLFLM